jgi:hypothetical protein
MKKYAESRRFTLDEAVSLAHCLTHLMDNTIDTDHPNERSWYYGNQEQFIKRHRKAIALIKSFLRNNKAKKMSPTSSDDQAAPKSDPEKECRQARGRARNVCVWSDPWNYKRKPQCREGYWVLYRGFVYCPFCGRKIEVKP